MVDPISDEERSAILRAVTDDHHEKERVAAKARRARNGAFLAASEAGWTIDQIADAAGVEPVSIAAGIRNAWKRRLGKTNPGLKQSVAAGQPVVAPAVTLGEGPA